MENIKIYHNPRCSKSREALKLLNDKGLNIDIILYMDNKLLPEELRVLLRKLNISAKELIRKNEKIYKEKNIKNNIYSEDELIELMIEYPNLMQRPIIEVNEDIIIARPPEKIIDLI